MVNALRASGDARFPLCTAIIFMWGVAIPLGYFLGIKMEMGLLGIWLGFFADEWLRGLTNAWRWRSRKWQSKRLDVKANLFSYHSVLPNIIGRTFVTKLKVRNFHFYNSN